MIDYHLHTSFSKDGKEDLIDICAAAKDKGIKYLAITDHLDYDETFSENWEIDNNEASGYAAQILKAQEAFPELDIVRGVEAGYTPSGNAQIKEAINQIKPDFAIGSLHFLKGVDPYDKRFFAGKTKKQAFDYYFETLLAAISPLSEYSNVIGHLTYVSKSPNMPYDDPIAHYPEYKGFIDDILKEIIAHGMGIEINTSGLFSSAKQLLPHYEIVKLYKNLGGEILTIGSDAHKIEAVSKGITDAIDVAKEAGFKYLTVFTSGKQTQIKI